MNPNEKKEILKNLSEKEFRQELIIPLLSKMGYLAPIEYHGNNEKGKDIIFLNMIDWTNSDSSLL